MKENLMKELKAAVRKLRATSARLIRNVEREDLARKIAQGQRSSDPMKAPKPHKHRA